MNEQPKIVEKLENITLTFHSTHKHIILVSTLC